MKKKLLTFLLALFCFACFGQTILYNENFDNVASYSGASANLSPTSFPGWANYGIIGGNNEWYILDNTNCTPISGNYSIGVSKNALNTSGLMPAATLGSARESIAYCTTQINASSYTSITLDFKWLGQGSGANAFGKVCYSLNGTTWIDFPTSGTYNGQNSVQTVTNLSLAAVNGQSFYLGFRWKNTATSGTVLSFQVDDIVVKGNFVAPIDNTDCAGAYDVPVNTGTTCSLSYDGDSNISSSQYLAGCSGDAADDVWYKFTATSTVHKINITRSGADPIADPVFEFFEGDCLSLSSRGCVNNNTFNNNPEEETFGCLTIGQEYYFRVYSYGSTNGNRGEFTICITTPSISFNDDPYSAIVLPVNGITCTTNTAGTTVGATDSGIVENCDDGQSPDDDVWYSFVATNQVHIVTVEDTGITNVTAEVYTGACSNLQWIGCSNASGGNTDEIFQLGDLTVGQQYFVRVYSKGTSSFDAGTFNICITTPVSPANSECSNAVALTVNPTEVCSVSTVGTTWGATTSYLAETPCDASTTDNNQGDVWYSFVATSTWHTITVTPNGIKDIVINLRGGACGSQSIDCENEFNFNVSEVLYAGSLTPGETYYVRVYNHDIFSQGAFTICVTTPCLPGSGSGTTDATYASVVAGEAGQNGADPTISCGTSSLVTLEAVYPTLNESTNYTVSKLSTYTLPYQIDCLANQINLEQEDMFSGVINMPFPICYFGQTYNQMVVSSNGVVTFKLSLANTRSGYRITQNSPSTNNCLNNSGNPIDFGACIMGAHTDFVPSDGGQVGWEEITLDNGGKALVIGFAKSYMYDEPTDPYESMIVIHKDTNIIDIFLKDKSLTTSYNSGIGDYHNYNRGVLGLENANSTIAVIPAGYNALDTPWTAHEEAWRFTPSGTAVNATVAWYEGSGTGGTFLGNGNTIDVSPTSTTTYTAAVTYEFCTGNVEVLDETTVNVSLGTVWNGSVSSDWDNPINWTPNVLPTLSDCVLVPITPNDPLISGLGYTALAGNVTVESGAEITISSQTSLTVTDWINVNSGGNIQVNNSGSIVQINDTVNTGSITLDRDVDMLKYDYVYWSTPVNDFTSNEISPLTSTSLIWKWEPTVPTNTNGFGTWVNGNEVMQIGRGYIVRGPNNFNNTTLQTHTATFSGTPNNGTINVPITRGTYAGADYTGPTNTMVTEDDDNWNLLGNPYPSSIDAIDFLNANTNLDGFIKVWTHGTLPSSAEVDPFYQDFSYNYTTDDYITYNVMGTSSGPGIFGGYIASGQGFFTSMLHSTASTNENVTFLNSMRSNTYDNSQFFRTSSKNELSDQYGRIWLDLISPSQNTSRILVGYKEGATYGRDRLYDAFVDRKSTFKLFSLINEEKMLIQGRPIPFDLEDKVDLGLIIPNDGIYTFAIGAIDGFFDNLNIDIYIEDKLTNTIHNIRQSPYNFTANQGQIDDRFVLRYTNNTNILSTNDVYITSDSNINITSKDIESVDVWNVLGQYYGNYSNVVDNKITINNIVSTNSMLIIKIKYSDGKTLTKKFIY